MELLKLLKGNTLRVALAASLVAPLVARCSPMPCYAQETSQEDAQKPLESDPLELPKLPDYSTPRASSSETERASPYTPWRGTVTRTDGLPDSQPIRGYWEQPFKGRSRSVTCVQVAPGIQSCN